jgi:hypothetical protein
MKIRNELIDLIENHSVVVDKVAVKRYLDKYTVLGVN